MKYYRFKNKYIAASKELKLPDEMKKISEDEIKKCEEFYYLFDASPLNTRTSFCISDGYDLFRNNEYIDILKKHDCNDSAVPEWMNRIIEERHAAAINIRWPSWRDALDKGIIGHKNKKRGI